MNRVSLAIPTGRIWRAVPFIACLLLQGSCSSGGTNGSSSQGPVAPAAAENTPGPPETGKEQSPRQADPSARLPQAVPVTTGPSGPDPLGASLRDYKYTVLCPLTTECDDEGEVVSDIVYSMTEAERQLGKLGVRIAGEPDLETKGCGYVLLRANSIRKRVPEDYILVKMLSGARTDVDLYNEIKALLPKFSWYAPPAKKKRR